MKIHFFFKSVTLQGPTLSQSQSEYAWFGVCKDKNFVLISNNWIHGLICNGTGHGLKKE